MVIVVADSKRDRSSGSLSTLPKDKDLRYQAKHVVVTVNPRGVNEHPRQRLLVASRQQADQYLLRQGLLVHLWCNNKGFLVRIHNREGLSLNWPADLYGRWARRIFNDKFATVHPRP